ncbi:MAG: hypothetical protein HC778_02130 [Chamaesiphon sp. CSU_1_12]|nr:hypothetical protein [Chamaesiphon sp. CSU_1_12]
MHFDLDLADNISFGLNSRWLANDLVSIFRDDLKRDKYVYVKFLTS